jgi:hypothetical protein
MATNKYAKGKIYKLVNNVDNEFYVGSTCDSLARRKGGHKLASVKKKHRKVYHHINNIGGFDNIDIILIETYPCNSKDELNARERYWIEELKPSLNKIIPTRTVKEYYENNKDHFAQYREHNKERYTQYFKEYQVKNREKIAQKRAEIIKCDCGVECSKSNLSRHIKSEKHQQWLQNQPSTSS